MFFTCQEVIDKVSAILDGEAGVVERARFHAHVAMCSECAEYIEQFRLVTRSAGVVGPEDLPSDFGKVMDFVLTELEG